MTNRWILWVLVAGCATPPPRREQPATPVTYVAYEEHGEIVATGPGAVPGTPIPTKNQPPHIKLKLGHFRNDQFNIGVTVDLTEMTDSVADIDPAKLRFDGDEKIWRLEGRHGGSGRIDYVRDHDRVMLQIERDGRVTVYITDPETDRSSGAIDLYRDADADPL